MFSQLTKAVRDQDNQKINLMIKLIQQCENGSLSNFQHEIMNVFDDLVNMGARDVNACDVITRLKNSISLKLKNKLVLRLISIAAANDDVDTMRHIRLTWPKVSYSMPTPSGGHPLITAAKKNACNTIRVLHEFGMMEEWEVPSKALFIAIRHYHIEATRVIVELLDQELVRHLLGDGSLRKATKFHVGPDLLEYVLELEERNNSTRKRKRVYSFDYFDMYLTRDNQTMIKHCVDLGLNINEVRHTRDKPSVTIVDNVLNGTYLYMCYDRDYMTNVSRTIRFLVECGAKIDPTSKHVLRFIEECVSEGRLDDIMFFMECGIDLSKIPVVQGKSITSGPISAYYVTVNNFGEQHLNKIEEFMFKYSESRKCKTEQRQTDESKQTRHKLDLFCTLQRIVKGYPPTIRLVNWIRDNGYPIPTLSLDVKTVSKRLIGSGTRKQWYIFDNLKWLASYGYVLEANGNKDTQGWLDVRHEAVMNYLRMLMLDLDVPVVLLKLISELSEGHVINGLRT